MREIRPSGLEGGVTLKPSSLPLSRDGTSCAIESRLRLCSLPTKTNPRSFISAAGLRHSRAPFPPERDCAESQSQQRDLTRDPSFFSEMFYENRDIPKGLRHSAQ